MTTPAHDRLVWALQDRGVHLEDFAPCPICQSRSNFEAPPPRHEADPICMRPECMYQRAKLKARPALRVVA